MLIRLNGVKLQDWYTAAIKRIFFEDTEDPVILSQTFVKMNDH